MSTEKAVTTAALKAILKLGAANGQTVKTLAFLLNTTDRAIRKLAEELIDEGTPVCAHPAHGYYIAQTLEEVDSTYKFLRNRAFHSLKRASQLRAAFTNDGVNVIQQLENEGAFA